MSFFKGVVRLLQGKPVFDSQSQTPTNHLLQKHKETSSQTEQQVNSPTTIQKNNPSTFPIVQIVRTETKAHGNNIQIYCYFQNTWSEELELGILRIFNEIRDLNFRLQAHATREILIYNGPSLDREKGREASLNYRTMSGNYFEAVYEIHYTHTSHNTYEVKDMRLRLPIRDIFG